MALPTMNGTGRLTADPELRYTPSGTAVATIRLAFNSRRWDEDRRQWVDGHVCYEKGTLFGNAAENATESYSRGDEVVLAGRVRTEQWQDKNTGENRQANALLIDGIGASTRSATATVARANRSQPAEQPKDDPWSRPAAPTADEPPF